MTRKKTSRATVSRPAKPKKNCPLINISQIKNKYLLIAHLRKNYLKQKILRLVRTRLYLIA